MVGYSNFYSLFLPMSRVFFCRLHCAYVVNFLFAHHKCLMLDWIYVDKNTQSPWFGWIYYINDVFGTNESIMHNFIEHGNRRQENDQKTKKLYHRAQFTSCFCRIYRPLQTPVRFVHSFIFWCTYFVLKNEQYFW